MYFIQPIIPSVLPTKVPLTAVTSDILLFILLTEATVGASVLIGWILTKVMQRKGFKTNLPINLALIGSVSFLTVLRFGFSLTTIQGILLSFVLLYASCSDLTNHTMDDFLWVMVAMLGLCSIGTLGLPSMLIGAGIVFVPQIAFAMFPPHRTLGGADIKLSTALAFLLGAWKGIGAYLVGLTLAVIVVSICNRKQNRCPQKPFALVPFLSIGAMIAFFI